MIFSEKKRKLFVLEQEKVKVIVHCEFLTDFLFLFLSLSCSSGLNPSFRGDKSSTRVSSTSGRPWGGFCRSLASTVGDLCDVPFLSVRTYMRSGTRLYRSTVALRNILKRYVECSSGVYDERWWLNELPRARAALLPDNQIRSSPVWCSWTKAPISDIDSYEAATKKIVSLSICAQVEIKIKIEITSNIHLVFLFDRFQFPLALRWADGLIERARFRLLHQKISQMQSQSHLK